MDTPHFDPVATLDQSVTAYAAEKTVRYAAQKAHAERVRAAFEPLVTAVLHVLQARQPLFNPEHFRSKDLPRTAEVKTPEGRYYHDIPPQLMVVIPNLYRSQSRGLEFTYQNSKYKVTLQREYDPLQAEFDHWIPAFEFGMKQLAPYIVRFNKPTIATPATIDEVMEGDRT